MDSPRASVPEQELKFRDPAKARALAEAEALVEAATARADGAALPVSRRTTKGPRCSITSAPGATTAVREAGREAQLGLIRAHPELAGKAMVAGTLIQNGKPSQVFVVRLAAKAVENFANHEMGSPPSATRSPFTAPKIAPRPISSAITPPNRSISMARPEPL